MIARVAFDVAFAFALVVLAAGIAINIIVVGGGSVAGYIDG